MGDAAKNVVKGLLTVKPDNRWDPEKLTNNIWVRSSAPSTAFDSIYYRNMQLHIAKKNLRKGVRAVIAINRFGRALKNLAEKEKNKAETKSDSQYHEIVFFNKKYVTKQIYAGWFT